MQPRFERFSLMRLGSARLGSVLIGSVRRAAAVGLGALGVVLLAACSSTSTRPTPTPLTSIAKPQPLTMVWSLGLGPVDFPLEVKTQGNQAALADGKGEVVVLDVRSGQAVWRASLKTPLSAGVGFDGSRAAVVTRNNDLVALEGGKEIWRSRLTAPSHTAPFVAGGRVFVLGADRAVSAFDGASGRRLWTQTRPGEPLVLRQNGVLMAVGDTLLAGFSGRLSGLNPLNGSIRWEAPVANPRGTNDVERLVDLVGPAARLGDEVCVRAFQSAVGCVNAARGTLLWTKPSAGSVGLSMDATQIFGSDEDGTLGAWRRNDGERVWSTQALRFRGLSAPLALDAGVLVGDAQGIVHLLAKSSGEPLARISLDGSAVVNAPVWLANTALVVTAKGLVAGLRPGN